MFEPKEEPLYPTPTAAGKVVEYDDVDNAGYFDLLKDPQLAGHKSANDDDE